VKPRLISSSQRYDRNDAEIQRGFSFELFGTEKISAPTETKIEIRAAVLTLPKRLELFHFEGIAMIDESSFYYREDSDPMCSLSPNLIIPRQRQVFRVNKILISIFFTVTRLLVFRKLPSDQTFTQGHFASQFVRRLLLRDCDHNRRIEIDEFARLNGV
jgi:hypothetical protein